VAPHRPFVPSWTPSREGVTTAFLAPVGEVRDLSPWSSPRRKGQSLSITDKADDEFDVRLTRLANANVELAIVIAVETLSRDGGPNKSSLRRSAHVRAASGRALLEQPPPCR
jgi:hypothetical protein